MRAQVERLLFGGLFLAVLVGVMWVADRVWVHGSTFIVMLVFSWAVGFAIEVIQKEGT